MKISLPSVDYRGFQRNPQESPCNDGHSPRQGWLERSFGLLQIPPLEQRRLNQCSYGLKCRRMRKDPSTSETFGIFELFDPISSLMFYFC